MRHPPSLPRAQVAAASGAAEVGGASADACALALAAPSQPSSSSSQLHWRSLVSSSPGLAAEQPGRPKRRCAHGLPQRTAADQEQSVLQLLAAHGVAAGQVDSMLQHIAARNLQLLELQNVQQLIEGLQAVGASSASIRRVLGETALPGYTWEHDNWPKLDVLMQLGLGADEAVNVLVKSKDAQDSRAWVEAVERHRVFLEGEVLQGGTLCQLLIDKSASTLTLLTASPSCVQAAATYLRDELGWGAGKLAKRVNTDPNLLASAAEKMQRNVQSICHTFHVPVKDVGKLAARKPMLLLLALERVESSVASLIEVMGTKEAAW